MEPTLARFAPAKINLFLEVMGKRPDGYHDIATVMETIAVGDLVEVAPARELVVETNRADVPSGAGNVAYKIIRAAEATLLRRLPARITITKALPPGSGLGAGSSDAVAALLLVLDLHGVTVPRASLIAIAAAAGSDTAFFVDGGLSLCTGRGEIVRRLPQRGVRHVVLVLPASECSTAEVYAALGPVAERRSPDALVAALRRGANLAGPPDSELVFNRLSEAADRAYLHLAARRAHLHRLARRRPHLAGSGGSFYFLCGTPRDARDLAAALRQGDPSLDVRETASYRGSG